MPPRISVQQRRARLGIRHHLAVRTAGVPATELVHDLVALHATDPASVYLSVAARADDLTAPDLGRALYDERALIRMLGMRRTMFVVPTSTAPVVQSSSSDAVATRIRRVLVRDLASVAPDPEAWLTSVGDSVVSHLRVAGGATAAALARAEPRLRTKIVYAEGKAYGGPVTLTSRILNILSAQGLIVRGRPGGGWAGSQYEWAPVDRWLPGGIGVLEPDAARAELVRQWLARFGPGTIADLTWWTGWNLRDTRRAVAAIETEAVELDGAPGLVLAADAEPVDEPEPWIALLPALDPTPMGWFGRDWYVSPDHRVLLFDRTGNIGPSVWCNGRVVGGWAQRADGPVRYRLFEDIGATLTRAVEAEVERLAAWVGEVRVIPKFRTPLERELAGS